MASTAARTDFACFRLLSRRPRWGLSAQGWLIASVVVASVGITGFLNLYSFLALNQPCPADLLAVEGWVSDHAIRAAQQEFQTGGYRSVFSTGGPVHGVGRYINDYSTAASIGAQRLVRSGVPSDNVYMVPSRVSARDRTYSSAVALREWLKQHQISPKAINVMTEDVHARRTQLLFQKALGPDITVGVITIPNPDYDAGHWWRYSQGVRDVLGESISYVYARFFFFPASPPAGGSLPSGHF